MIIPRYSLRWLLALTAVCGVLSLILSYAFQGSEWAIGASVGLASLLMVAAIHAAAFSVAWLLTQFGYGLFGGSASQAAGQSPFAHEHIPLKASSQTSDPEPPAIMS
jgi:hypothetical protein